MNQVFKKDLFWNLFWNLEIEDIEDFRLEKQMEILGQDFPFEKDIDEDLVSYEVKFPFDCGQKYSLLLECSFREDFVPSCNKSLQLKDKTTGECYEMGWWDLARWHPYCLRPEELKIFIKYWKRFDPTWGKTDLPLLLLIHFVGFENKAQAEFFLRNAEQICQNLGVSAEYLQINNWIEAIEREKYCWRIDQELDWTVGNDDYSCYSLRNKEHYDAANDEAGFPFKKFARMYQEVYDRLNS